jgi:hypothetical protein
MQCISTICEELSTHEYPATKAELVEAYGSVKCDTENPDSFGEVMGRLGETTFHDEDAAKEATLSVMSEAAIGRKGYSDRDAPTVGEQSDAEILSF